VRGVIDMTAVRQAVALVQDVNGHGQGRGAELHVRRVARLAQAEPELFAAVAVVLASMVDQDVTAGVLLHAMAGLDMDIEPALREAHRRYESYRGRGRLLDAPEWVLAGERLYARAASRRHRARKAVQAG
jgi:hypothetical protein